MLVALVQAVLFQLVLFAPLVDSAGESNGFVAGLAFGLGLLFTLLALTFVQAATARALVEIDEGRPISALGAYRLSLDSVRPLAGGLAIAAVVITILNLTLWGIPIAIWLIARWSLLAQVVELEEWSARSALRRSAKLVRGHWFG